METPLIIIPKHGLVFATLAASFLNGWMAHKVGQARRKYKVGYPNLYADKDHPNANEFNCIQRGHQSTLELSAAFHTLLLTAGLKYPLAASVAGLAYLVARVVYFRGYSTGNPKSRSRGVMGVPHQTRFYVLPLLALVGMTATWAVQLLIKL